MQIVITLSSQERDIFAMYEGDVDFLVTSQMEGRMARNKERIVRIVSKQALDAGDTLPGSETAIISMGFNKGWIAADKSLDEAEAEAGLSNFMGAI